MRWADCEDDERKEEEEREQETEKETRQETRQEELTSEKPPGLVQKEESEHGRKDEEERRAHEAREEERRAQEAREPQDAQEQEARAQEEQEKDEGKEDMTTQEKCVETKKETNSMHEENDVSNRHMTWWKKRMVDPYGRRTTHADGARPSTNLASSQKGGRTGSRR